MLTMCRTLMGDPDLVIIDEPTEGLAPKLVEQVGRLLDEIARRGTAILLVERSLPLRSRSPIACMSWVMGESCSRARLPTLPRTRRSARNGWKSDAGRLRT